MCPSYLCQGVTLNYYLLKSNLQIIQYKKIKLLKNKNTVIIKFIKYHGALVTKFRIKYLLTGGSMEWGWIVCTKRGEKKGEMDQILIVIDKKNW